MDDKKDTGITVAYKDNFGKFTKGNRGGPGNTAIAERTKEHHKAFLNAVTAGDTAKVVKQLLKFAIAGEPWAIKEYLNRVLGKPLQQVEANVTTDSTTTFINALVTDDSDGRRDLIAGIIASRALPASPASAPTTVITTGPILDVTPSPDATPTTLTGGVS